MSRVVLYRRVSTGEQAESGLGLAAQRERLADEADRRGWGSPEWVTDEGVSARTPAAERDELGPALAGMGEGDVLVVAKLDRLSRSVHDFAGLLTRATGRGWSVVALDLGIDTTTPTGELIAHMVVAIAQWEAAMIALRTREGLAQSSKRLGRAPGLPAVGGGKPAPVPAGVEAVVRDALAADLTPQRIADRLNEYGLPSLRGGRWHRESVRRLLARPELAASAA